MENKDRLKPASAAASEPSCGDMTQQPKNNVLELSFKTRRHFVFCSAATSPRRRPILGPGSGLRAGLKLEPLQDRLASPTAGLQVSSSAMFLEDHDYSSPAKRGGGSETGSCKLPVIPLTPKPKLASVMYNGLASDISQCSKISAESVGNDANLRHGNPVSDLMQAMCEEAMQVDCDVPGLGEKPNRPPGSDTQGICDFKNGENHNPKTPEVSKFLAPSALTVKFQKLDVHKSGGIDGFENSTSTQARNPTMRSSWSSSTKQISMGRTNRCVKSAYPDSSSSSGVKAGPSPSKYHLFKVDIGSHSTTATTCLPTLCDDQSSFLPERPTSGSLDSAQTGMILPSPFLIQTGLEKTLDFAEFHPMSPSNKDWESEFCCPPETGLETPSFENEVTKTCDLTGVSAFDCQDFPVHQNIFSSPPDPNRCMQMQKSLCAASDTQTTSAKAKPSSKWYSKRQECLKANFDSYPFTLEDLQVRRRKPVKRQLDFGSPFEMAEETVNDLDRKKALNTIYLNKPAQERQEQTEHDLHLSNAEEKQRARHSRRPKKLGDPGKTGKGEFGRKLDALEKTANRIKNIRKYRIKSEIDVNGAHSDITLTNGKASVSTNQFNDPTSCISIEQEQLSRRAVNNDILQRAPADLSVDFCDILSMVLDRWLEYLMTPHDVMRQRAIDDARYFGYNDDALDMISNGDLEVWRILEDMEPEFVRSGIEKYFT